MKIFILPNGNVVSRYDDIFVRSGLIIKEVRRVSQVEWDASKAQWCAQISTYKLCAPTREMVLDREKVLIDYLLEDVCKCWDPVTNTFRCPGCKLPIVPVEVTRCTGCGYKFQNFIEGMKLSDFPFAELLKSQS